MLHTYTSLPSVAIHLVLLLIVAALRWHVRRNIEQLGVLLCFGLGANAENRAALDRHFASQERAQRILVACLGVLLASLGFILAARFTGHT